MSLSDLFPSDWHVGTVGQAGSVIVGQQKNPENSAASKQYPYLRVANVHDDDIHLDDVALMGFSAAARERLRLRTNDILLCEGQSRELVGRSAMFRGELSEAYFQNTVIRFRSFSHIIPEYALIVFRAYQKTGVFSSIATSTTSIAHLGLRRFSELPFPVPSRPVQQAIADCGRAVQDAIDIALKATQEASKAIREFPATVRDNAILSAITALADYVQWQTTADVVATDAPIVYGILQPGPDVSDPSGVPYIRGQDLRDGEILEDQLRRTSQAIAQRYQRSALETGDVLLGIIRSTRVAIVPPELDGAHITQGTARLRPGDKVDSDYLAHWLAGSSTQDWLAERMRGIDMPGLNLRDVRKIPVPVLPFEQQRNVASQLDSFVEVARALSRSVQAAESMLQSLETAALASIAFGQVALRIQREIGIGELLKPPARADGQRSTEARASRPQARDARDRRIMVDDVSEEAVLNSFRVGSNLTPEELFSSLQASTEAVDSFYAALRSLVRSGILRVIRSEDSTTLERVR